MKKGQTLSILLVIVLVVLAACAPGGEEAAKDPIKICFFAPVSSTSAESAKDMRDAFQMFWDEHGMEINGRPVGPARTFADVRPGEAFWYANSNGLVEFAVNLGRASDELGVGVGSTFSVVD